MYRDFQARLARIQEPLKRRLKDNTIELAGVPVDTIRISYKKNDEGDITSRIIEKATVDQIIWPPLKNIPFRRLGKNGENGYKITSLVESATDEKTAEIYKIIWEGYYRHQFNEMISRIITFNNTTGIYKITN